MRKTIISVCQGDDVVKDKVCLENLDTEKVEGQTDTNLEKLMEDLEIEVGSAEVSSLN